MAEVVEARELSILRSKLPAGIMALPAEAPKTLIDPLTARSPLTVMVPVREEMEASRSSKDRRPTCSLPVMVSEGTWVSKIEVNLPDSVAYTHISPPDPSPIIGEGN